MTTPHDNGKRDLCDAVQREIDHAREKQREIAADLRRARREAEARGRTMFATIIGALKGLL